MSANTSIEWTNHTFNPWWGCTKVSPGCDNCYAESWAKRFGVRWGPNEVRRPATERTWSEPLKWNAQAQKEGVRRRVFCASMADVFDNEGLAAEREWLWELIEETPALDWLLLTKRAGNVMGMIPTRWRDKLPTNVWPGATIVNQEEANRDIVKLLKIPAGVHFLSCEPLLGPINLRRLQLGNDIELDALTGFHSGPRAPLPPILPGIDWVIVGGESGRKARPMHPDWARSLRDQCTAAWVPFLFKQWGQFLPACDPKAHNYSYDDDRCEHEWDKSEFGYSIRVRSKYEAGRELDGRTWDEFPRTAA